MSTQPPDPVDELVEETERLGLYDDPWPLCGGICGQCGQEYNNFGGRCYACTNGAGGCP